MGVFLQILALCGSVKGRFTPTSKNFFFSLAWLCIENIAYSCMLSRRYIENTEPKTYF